MSSNQDKLVAVTVETVTGQEKWNVKESSVPSLKIKDPNPSPISTEGPAHAEKSKSQTKPHAAPLSFDVKVDSQNLVLQEVDSVVGKSNWLVRPPAPKIVKMTYDSKNPPLAAHIVALFSQSSLTFLQGNKTELILSNGETLTTNFAIARYLVRSLKSSLYGDNDAGKIAQVENYLEISLDIKVTKNAKLVEEINAQLSKSKTGFLVGNSASLADFAVLEALHFSGVETASLASIQAWKEGLQKLPEVSKTLQLLQKKENSSNNSRFTYNENNIPLAALISASIGKFNANFQKGTRTEAVLPDGNVISGNLAVARYLARSLNLTSLYEQTDIAKFSQIESFLDFSIELKTNRKLTTELDAILGKGNTGFFVGNSVTLADLAIFETISNSNISLTQTHLKTWFESLTKVSEVAKVTATFKVSKDVKPKAAEKSGNDFVANVQELVAKHHKEYINVDGGSDFGTLSQDQSKFLSEYWKLYNEKNKDKIYKFIETNAKVFSSFQGRLSTDLRTILFQETLAAKKQENSQKSAHPEKQKLDSLKIFKDLMEMEKVRQKKSEEETIKKSRKYEAPKPSTIHKDALLTVVHNQVPEVKAPENSFDKLVLWEKLRASRESLFQKLALEVDSSLAALEKVLQQAKELNLKR